MHIEGNTKVLTLHNQNYVVNISNYEDLVPILGISNFSCTRLKWVSTKNGMQTSWIAQDNKYMSKCVMSKINDPISIHNTKSIGSSDSSYNIIP